MARDLWLLFAAAMAFATSSPLARAAVGVPPLAVAAGRTVLAALALFALAPRSTLRAVLAVTARQRLGLVVSGALLAMHFALFLSGLAATSYPAAVALVSLEPLAVVLAAWWTAGVRPTPREALGVGLATFGALVVASAAGEGEHTLKGDLLVLGAVAVYGGYVAAARHLREALPPLPYAAVVYAVATVALAPLALPAALAAAPPPLAGVLAVVGLALVPTLIGHTLVQRAARTVSPSLVALVSPGETVGSLVIGLLWLHATPTPREMAGALLVIAGAVVTVRFPGSRGLASPPTGT